LSLYYKIIVIILGLAYLVSPWDILPEAIASYLGLIDDFFVISTIVYILKYNRLPDLGFLNKFKGFKSNKNQNNYQEQSAQQQKNASKQKPNNNSKDPYEILEIPPGSSKADIHLAYKAAIKKYHPDKVSHLGEEFAHLANEKFLDIQKAYDSLINK
jgi:uncharacterized membrane protein YkvA (DUF1232 family)